MKQRYEVVLQEWHTGRTPDYAAATFKRHYKRCTRLVFNSKVSTTCKTEQDGNSDTFQTAKKSRYLFYIWLFGVV